MKAHINNCKPDRHGKYSAPNNETRLAHFPLPSPLPQAGEGDKDSLREFHNISGKRKSESGFSLVTAIFLLVVLAGLGTMMVTFFATQQQSSAKDVMGSRAYQAARAGIEWAAYGVSGTTAGTLWGGCATGVTFATGTLGGTLSPFNVVVTCTSSAFTEGTSTIYIYTIISTATGVNGATPGSTDYIERDITMKMGR